jgi:hypothetical protein
MAASSWAGKGSNDGQDDRRQSTARADRRFAFNRRCDSQSSLLGPAGRPKARVTAE